MLELSSVICIKLCVAIFFPLQNLKTQQMQQPLLLTQPLDLPALSSVLGSLQQLALVSPPGFQLHRHLSQAYYLDTCICLLGSLPPPRLTLCLLVPEPCSAPQHVQHRCLLTLPLCALFK